MREPIGKLVLPFDSLKTLANGGAEVHLYLNSITGKKQVGKRIDLLGQDALLSFHEAKLLQTITHDNLVPVFDVAVLPEYPPPMRVIELIMPYYERGSVCDAMLGKGTRFSVGQAVRLTLQALRGLGELHDVHAIVHRDMKSANVFLTDEGDLRVGDLGACSPIDANGEAEPYRSMQPSTPPETYVADRIGRSYDIFGVGLLLFELLNGPLPYPYDPTANLKRLEKGQLATPERDLSFQPHVPPRLRTIVRKALARDPKDRYQSVAPMRAAISSAPYIDWCPPLIQQDSIRWEGTLAARPDVSFQVEATRRRSSRRAAGAWVLTGRQRLRAWRRLIDDRIVPEPIDRAAMAFFDQMLSAALSS